MRDLISLIEAHEIPVSWAVKVMLEDRQRGEKGRWVTTSGGAHVFIDKGGHITKGNATVVAALAKRNRDHKGRFHPHGKTSAPEKTDKKSDGKPEAKKSDRVGHDYFVSSHFLDRTHVNLVYRDGRVVRVKKDDPRAKTD